LFIILNYISENSRLNNAVSKLKSNTLNNIYTSEYVEKPKPVEMKYVTMSIW